MGTYAMALFKGVSEDFTTEGRLYNVQHAGHYETTGAPRYRFIDDRGLWSEGSCFELQEGVRPLRLVLEDLFDRLANFLTHGRVANLRAKLIANEELLAQDSKELNDRYQDIKNLRFQLSTTQAALEEALASRGSDVVSGDTYTLVFSPEKPKRKKRAKSGRRKKKSKTK